MTIQTLPKQQSAFDCETSDLDPIFGQVLQVAVTQPACSLSQATKVFEASIRRSPNVLPQPDALLATGVSFANRNDVSQRTEYGLAVPLAKWFREQRNTTFHAFNSGFDRAFLENMFFRNCLDPWVLVKDGRAVSDARQTLLASSLLDGGISIFQNPDGTWSSKQEAFAAANNLEYAAHDAKEDAATLWNLLGLATSGSPELTESLNLTFDKARLADAVCRAPFYIAVAFSRTKGPRLEGRVIIGKHPKYSNQQLAVRLGYLDEPAAIDKAVQSSTMTSLKDVRFCRFKANSSPMTIIPGQPLMSRLLTRKQQDQFTHIANLARRNHSLYRACVDAEIAKISSYAIPEFPESQMISHGFWTPADMSVAQRFHAVDPASKPAVICEMQDDRMRHFAEQIAYSNFPNVLPPATLKRLDEYCAWRLRTDEEVPWITIPKALNRIDELLPTCLADPKRLLENYRENLLELQSNPIQR